MAGQYGSYPVNSIPKYANQAALPANASNGDLAVTLDTDTLWIYSSGAGMWEIVGGTSVPLSVGTLDAQPANAQGAAIASNQLFMQSADATHPGLVNNTTQIFSGNKTFTGTIAASNLSGTNTGDVTLSAVGVVPNANAASLTGQVLNLQPFNSSFPGVVTASGGGTANFLRADGTWATPSGTGISSINALTATAQLLVTGTSGTDFTINSSVATHTFNLPVASATNTGKLSNTDWSTFNSKQDTGVGIANYFAGFDGSNNLEAVPGFQIDTTSGGMSESLTENPNNVGGGFNANSFNTSFQPLQNSPNDDWNIQSINVDFDSANSGFSQGTTGEAATLLSLNVNHGATGPIGGVNQIKSNYSLGNGTDPLTLKSLTTHLSFADINDNVTIDGGLQGFTHQPHVHSAAIGTSNFSYNGFIDNANLEIPVNGYNSFTNSSTLNQVNNNFNYNAFTTNPIITTLQGNAGLSGYGFFPQVTTVGANGQVVGMNMNPTITTLGTNGNYQAITANGTVTTMGSNSQVNGFNWTPAITTSHGTIQGINIGAQIAGGDAQFTGVNISPSGGSTLTDPIGVRVQLSNINSTNPQGTVGIESDSRLSVNASTQLKASQGFQIGTRIEHLFTVPNGSPVTGTDELAVNIAGDFLVQDDVSDGGFGIGYNAVGFISSLGVAATKTVDTLTVFLPVSALPDPGFTTGGTVTDFSLIRTFAPLAQGGTLAITNLYGLKIDNFGGQFSAAATNAWGIYVEDTALPNHFGGSVDMGSLVLNGSTSGTLTMTADPVTTSYALKWPAAQGTSGQIPTNDGSGNLSWTTPGTPTTVVFQAVLTANQSVTATNQLKYDQVNFDSASGYNTGTGQYTVPSTGYYQVSVTDTSTTVSNMYIVVNGASTVYITSSVGGGVGGGSQVVSVSSGQTISINTDTTALFSGNAGPYLNAFSIAKVG